MPNNNKIMVVNNPFLLLRIIALYLPALKEFFSFYTAKILVLLLPIKTNFLDSLCAIQTN